jgi:aldehyde dehydrogenase (NAD+)
MVTDRITTTTDIERLFKAQQQNRWNVANTDASTRITKLKRLHEAVLKYRQAFRDALYQDFHKPAGETDLVEIYPVTSEIKHAIKHVRQWMQTRAVDTPMALLGTSGKIQYEAKGVCLIISPWNFPVNLTLNPLISAIAAGNCAILKPSEMIPYTSAVLKQLINETFTENEVAVVEGDVNTATELLKLPFDHIFFTGAPAIGKVVMRAAAEHLTSVTLELGGKSPVIIDETADLDAAARRTVAGKYTNSGQICVAPDYVLVHESKKEALIDKMKTYISKFYGASETERQKGEYTHMVNARHFNRVKSYLDDAILRGAKIEVGGILDSEKNYISPTIITNVTPDMLVMQEEIFGPILPVLTCKNIEEVTGYINQHEKPLALYIFSRKKANQDYILRHTSAGGVTVNDVALHFYNGNLPFGGVNNSGIGKAHGEFGFQEFSNAKAVLKQHMPKAGIEMMYPPFTNKVMKLIDMTIKWL